MPRKPACHKLTEALGEMPRNGGCQVTVGFDSVSVVLLDIACAVFDRVEVKLDIRGRKDRAMFKGWMAERYGNISKCPRAGVVCSVSQSVVAITQCLQQSTALVEMSGKEVIRYTKTHHLPIFVSLDKEC